VGSTGRKREKFEALLLKALTEEELDFHGLIHARRPPAALPIPGGERIPTRIDFDNETSENRTVIDIETEDAWACSMSSPRL